MPAPQIDELPPAPVRGDRLNFPIVADAFVAALPDFRSQTNAVGEFVEERANEAEAAQQAAAASAGLAGASADIAAAVAGFAGAWEDLTGPLSMPASVAHDDAFWILIQDVADVTAHEPGVSVAWAAQPQTPADQVRVAPIPGITGDTAQEVLAELAGRTIPVATEAEALAGTVNDKALTPHRLRQAFRSGGWAGSILPVLDQVTVSVTQVASTYNKGSAPASASWTVAGAPAGTAVGDTVWVTITSGGLDAAYSGRAYVITAMAGSVATIGPGASGILGNPNVPGSGSGNATLRYTRHLRRGNPGTYAFSGVAGKVTVLWAVPMPEGYSIQCSNLGADSNAVTWARPAGTPTDTSCLVNCVVGTVLTDPTRLSIVAS
jgi:hypothetical protein